MTATVTVTPAAPPPQQTDPDPDGDRAQRGDRRVDAGGISVQPATGTATFATGTSVTLRVSSGRSVVWSGACSSGGNKTKTCTFTLNANAAVTANVQ